MNKKIKITILGILFAIFPISFCCQAQRAEAQEPGKSFVKVFRELTILKCVKKKKCKKGTYSSVGSGFSIFTHKKHDTVMTAGHVCNQNITKEEFGDVLEYSVVFKVINYKKELKTAIPIIVSEKIDNIADPDLCMLYVEGLNIPKLKLSSRAPKVGEDVVAMSSPGGIYHPPTVPIFKGVYSGKISNATALVTVTSSPGSSGGPVMLTNNRVIGIIYAVSIFNSSVTLMNDYPSSKAFLNRVKIIIDNYEKQLKQ